MENIEYKGYTIKIDVDESSFDPREDDNIGIMVCFHKRYSLGDKTELKSSDFEGWQELENYLRKKEKAIVILPLYLYDHSGISIATYRHGQHASWDCGQVGFIYTTREQLKKMGTKNNKKKLEQYLMGEVETYNKYISGQVLYFSIEDENGIQIDSCGGWYDENDAIKEAKSIIDYNIKDRNKEIPKGCLIN
jgi:hypothetical protein